MELQTILSKCDHTLLAQTATWAEIKAVCDDGIKYHTASVCIRASFVICSQRPSLAQPMLMTMSTSSAPLSTASEAIKHLAAVVS